MLMRARKLAGRAREKVGFALGGERDLRLAQQKIDEKNVRLRKLREQVGKKDREISRLRAELDGSTEATMPVFFIVGFAKSGTSWLMRTLNYHPEILCTG